VPRVEAVLRRFGESTPGDPNTPNAVAVHLRDHGGDIADVVRALDSAGVAVAHLALHAPTLDDVFLIKTGRKLEGEGAPEPEAEPEVHADQAVPAPLRLGNQVTGVRQVRQWLADTRAHGLPGPAMLLVRQGPLAGREVPVADQVIVGREGDFRIDDPEISRRHALLRLVDGSLVIADLGSLNGTWVNGWRITSATLLSPGDHVALGRTVMEVRAERGTAAAPPA
jgi:hypothetical protein